MSNKEIEIKFGVLGNSGKAIFDVLYVLDNALGDTTARLSNTYFDTRDQQLFAMGAGLRIRRGPDFCEQTLKLRGENLGGVHSRGEFNVPIPAEQQTPDLSLFPSSVFPAGMDLKKVQDSLTGICDINFTRRSINFSFGGSRFEAAYDCGSILLDGEEVLPVSELEIELKSSDRPESELLLIFNSLTGVLAERQLPLVMEPFSKMHRAALKIDNRRNFVSFAPRPHDGNIRAYILRLLTNFETLYGLFLLRRDPLIFGCYLACLRVLIRSLRRLARSGLAAFSQGQRDPVMYRDDLLELVGVLKDYLGSIQKYERLTARAALRPGGGVRALIADLRHIENEYLIYLIPLKLRMLMSMLVEGDA